MPYKEKEIQKLYWTIGEVTKMLGVTHSQLRFWESEFDITLQKKNKKGDRFYRKEDIEHLRRIKYLLKEKGYTIRGAKEKLKQNGDPADVQPETLETLKKIRAFLLTLRGQL